MLARGALPAPLPLRPAEAAAAASLRCCRRTCFSSFERPPMALASRFMVRVVPTAHAVRCTRAACLCVCAVERSIEREVDCKRERGSEREGRRCSSAGPSGGGGLSG